MQSDINWEIKLPSFLNNSAQEIIDITNSILISNFKDSMETWLNEQVENNNLKSFKKNKPVYYKHPQRDFISILDLKFCDEIYLKTFSYIIKIPFDSQIYHINQHNFKISVSEPWFIEIHKLNIKQLKTQKNVTVYFSLGLKYNQKIPNDQLYPNVDCNHDFRILYNGNWNWHLIWECKKCGFICFCSCFKEAIEACRQGKIITETKIQYSDGEEEILRRVKRVREDENWILKERGFTLKDLNLNINDLPYYANACEVCRGKTSSHQYCHKMYARSEFERKYGAYAKKKFFEYKLLNEEIDDEDLERRTNNLTREELGFRKIGERFVSETELYRITKSIFSNNKVIHHYRAKWLEGQEIDIFVPHLNLAIEYDGIQHFKPIKAWGGEEGLKMNIERDKIKEEKCKENNVTLIRFSYKENDLLSENYVKSKLMKYRINFN